MIRTASFKRRGFSLIELELWKQRTHVKHIYRVTYTEARCRVVYK